MRQLIAFVLLLVAVPAEAKPHWRRITFKAAVLAGTSYFQWRSTTYCDRGNIEACWNSGYGWRNHSFVKFSIIAGIAADVAGEKCHNDDGPKPACYTLDYFVPATQTAFGIHDYLSYKPKEKEHAIHSTLATLRRQR